MAKGHTQNLGKDIVALVAMIAAAGWAGWLLARQSLDIGAAWSDGEGSVSSISGDAVRHAIWDDAQDLGGGVNGTDREGRPAISPDGRLLVFSVGERGLNAELWVADLDGQRIHDARPLTKLNTAADEMAPAFGSDALWFASDRGGENFGLDLWRVPYGDGHFGTPEPAGAGINSSADDTDPFPMPGTRALAFASNRLRGARTDFDLFGALPREARDAEGNRIDEPGGENETWVVGTLASLNTPFEEREPALTPDGRALLFASDRAGSNNGPGGARSFDLYRSFRTAEGGPGGWLEPRPLIGLNTLASERAPLPTEGGFALLFQRAAGSDGGNILRARSRELFQLPQAPLSLTELLILVLLVTIGVLAILAKRWRAIDILYKCFLVSVLAHMLLLLWFREVVPESDPVATQDVERVFRVRLALESGGTRSSLQERSGELAAERATAADSSATPSRTELQADLENSTDAAPTSSESMDTSRAPEESAPLANRLESNQASGGRSSAPSEVAAPERLSPEYGDRAPSLTHTATEGDQLPAQRTESLLPTATTQADTVLASAAASPNSGDTVVTTRARGDDAASAPRRLRTATPTSTTGTIERKLTQVTGPAPLQAEEVGNVAEMSLGVLDGTQENRERESLEGQSPELRSDQPAIASAPESAAPAQGEAVQLARQDISEGATETGNRRRMTDAGERGRRETALAGPATLAAINAGEGAAGNPAATQLDAGALAFTERTSGSSNEGPGRANRSHSGESREPSVEAPTPNGTLVNRSEQRGQEDDGPQRRSLSAPQRGSSTPTSELRALEVADSGDFPIEMSDEGHAELALRPTASNATRRERAASGPGRAAPSEAPAEGATGTLTPQDNSPVLGSPRRRLEQFSGPSRQSVSGPERRSLTAAADLRAPATGSGAATELAATSASPSEQPEFELNPSVAPPARRTREAGGPRRRSPWRPERAAMTGTAPVPQAQPLVAAAPPTERIDDAPRRSREQNAYSNRFGDARLRALEEFGGGVETERAVALGLQYLASKQNANGSWGSRRDFDRDKYRDVRIGKSGLALLAFMGAGHLPGGITEYAPVSAKAVAYLKSLVSERTGHVGDGASYSHAIATYALAECFALTEDASLRAPLERAIARILVAQNQRNDRRLFGGWGYYFSDGSVWDDDRWPRVSVTAWQVMALESARLAGLEVPDKTFDSARRFLANAWDGDRGAFRYNHNPQRLRSGYPILPASTPAALFGLSLLGVDLESPDLRSAWDFVSRRRPREYRNRGDDAFVFDAKGNLYFWYYGTLASFRRGGSTWERWNIAMQETLLPAQEEDGSWSPISTYSRYAGDTDRDRTYSTAINVLSLEVYYRYFTPLLQVR
ncbi:MAG: hypothetical protein ACI8QS_000925 [Planctomycetota bacterium]|jgi:hypothetical protein